MWKCKECGTEFDLTDEEYNKISTGEGERIEKACPNGCKYTKFIVGAELNYIDDDDISNYDIYTIDTQELTIDKFIEGVESIYNQLSMKEKNELDDCFSIDCATDFIKAMLYQMDEYVKGRDFYNMY